MTPATAQAREADFSPRDYGLLTAGAVLFYAVCVSFFYGRWPIELHEAVRAEARTWFNISICFTSLLWVVWMAVVRTPFPRVRLTAGYAFVAIALGAVGWAAVGDPARWLPLSYGLAGVGSTLVTCELFRRFSAYPPRNVAWALGAMYLVGMGLGMASELLDWRAALPLHGLALAGSVACVALAAPRATPARRAPGTADLRSYVDAFLVPTVCTAAFSIAYSMINIIAYSHAPSPLTSLLTNQTGGLVAAAAFVACFGLTKRRVPSSWFNVVFGILATAILVLPFTTGAYIQTLNGITAGAWKFALLALFYLVIVTFAHDSRRLLTAAALAFALPRAMLRLGNAVIHLVGVPAPDDALLTAVMLFLLYLVSLAAWALNSRERTRADRRAREAASLLERCAQTNQDLLAARCAVLAQAHGLTGREQDILTLLAQGRDTAFVTEAYTLSKNTVKGYQKSIYAKLGVHGKQELIDLVHDVDVA